MGPKRVLKVKSACNKKGNEALAAKTDEELYYEIVNKPWYSEEEFGEYFANPDLFVFSRSDLCELASTKTLAKARRIIKSAVEGPKYQKSDMNEPPENFYGSEEQSKEKKEKKEGKEEKEEEKEKEEGDVYEQRDMKRKKRMDRLSAQDVEPNDVYNACTDVSDAALKTLKRWAKELEIPGYRKLSKIQLCASINKYLFGSSDVAVMSNASKEEIKLPLLKDEGIFSPKSPGRDLERERLREKERTQETEREIQRMRQIKKQNEKDLEAFKAEMSGKLEGLQENERLHQEFLNKEMAQTRLAMERDAESHKRHEEHDRDVMTQIQSLQNSKKTQEEEHRAFVEQMQRDLQIKQEAERAEKLARDQQEIARKAQEQKQREQEQKEKEELKRQLAREKEELKAQQRAFAEQQRQETEQLKAQHRALLAQQKMEKDQEKVLLAQQKAELKALFEKQKLQLEEQKAANEKLKRDRDQALKEQKIREAELQKTLEAEKRERSRLFTSVEEEKRHHQKQEEELKKLEKKVDHLSHAFDHTAQEKEKLQKEKLQKEKLEKEKLEKEKLQKEKLQKEKEKLEKEKLEKEKLEKEKQEKEIKEKFEKEKLEKEKLQKEKLQKEKLEKEQKDEKVIEKEGYETFSDLPIPDVPSKPQPQPQQEQQPQNKQLLPKQDQGESENKDENEDENETKRETEEEINQGLEMEKEKETEQIEEIERFTRQEMMLNDNTIEKYNNVTGIKNGFDVLEFCPLANTLQMIGHIERGPSINEPWQFFYRNAKSEICKYLSGRIKFEPRAMVAFVEELARQDHGDAWNSYAMGLEHAPLMEWVKKSVLPAIQSSNLKVSLVDDFILYPEDYVGIGTRALMVMLAGELLQGQIKKAQKQGAKDNLLRIMRMWVYEFWGALFPVIDFNPLTTEIVQDVAKLRKAGAKLSGAVQINPASLRRAVSLVFYKLEFEEFAVRAVLSLASDFPLFSPSKTVIWSMPLLKPEHDLFSAQILVRRLVDPTFLAFK